MAADTEGTRSKHTSLCLGSLGTLLVQNIEEYSILCLAGYDDDIVEVLGSCTNQRDTANIYLFDDIFF